jgi:hypothetical protein
LGETPIAVRRTFEIAERHRPLTRIAPAARSIPDTECLPDLMSADHAVAAAPGDDAAFGPSLRRCRRLLPANSLVEDHAAPESERKPFVEAPALRRPQHRGARCALGAITPSR